MILPGRNGSAANSRRPVRMPSGSLESVLPIPRVGTAEIGMPA